LGNLVIILKGADLSNDFIYSSNIKVLLDINNDYFSII